MEAARLGLTEYGGGRGGLSLPSDPWLGPPLLPGFLAHPPAGYPSYLAPPLVPDRPASPRAASPPDHLRTTSIAALRLKAKEHVETLGKTLHIT